MRPVLRTTLGVVVVIVALLGGFAGGWYLRPTSSGSAPTTLAVAAAGSLAPILPSMAAAFANATPGVNAAPAADLFEGSAAAASVLNLPDQPYDAFVSADFRVIPQHLEPPSSSVTRWEVVFAADPLVLAYAPGAAGLSGLNATNWYAKVVAPGVTLGVPNASADPLGANVIFALELTDAQIGASGAFYGHFFSGGFGGLARPTSATRYVVENDAATALDQGIVSIYLTYRSYAQVNRLAYVPLNDSVNLGGISPADVREYSGANTTVLVGRSTATEQGTPVLFALTVPDNAPDYPLGLAFAEFLLSSATAITWAADGFVPLAPLWTDAPGQLPAALAGTAPGGVAPLPTDLAAVLG